MKIRTFILSCTDKTARHDAIKTIRNIKFPIAEIIKLKCSSDLGHIYHSEGYWTCHSGFANNSILKWCDENCCGKYAVARKNFYYAFEHAADAIKFKLVWG